MAKLVINSVSSGFYSTTALNTAFDAIETAIENTVSRDGTSPNQMEADLDLNGNDLLNVGSISTQGLSVGGTSFSAAITSAQDAAAAASAAAEVATSVAALASAATCCLDSATSFFDFGLITDTAALFPTDFGSVV